MIKSKCVFTCNVFTDQLKQTDGQSEAAKQKELQRKIDQLKAEISQLDSQISGTEEHLATQGTSSTLSKAWCLIRPCYRFRKTYFLACIFNYLLTEQSVTHTWAQVEDSQRRELLLQAFRQRCITARKMLSDDTQKISAHCQALEQMAK